tara:strand:+ start:668 stop:925 length:258 start_codon:yes stop_codon:yes gene_type:complete
MILNKEELKSKIIYRSSYRGSKEMDILLSSFVKSVINLLNLYELKLLDVLVNLDDENLLKLKNNLKTTITIKENKITKLFKEFNL